MNFFAHPTAAGRYSESRPYFQPLETTTPLFPAERATFLFVGDIWFLQPSPRWKTLGHAQGRARVRLMTRHQLALLIGGVFPAILLGLSSICQKLSTTAGIGAGPMLIVIGLTSAAVGAVFCADGDPTWTKGGVAFACLFGACWAAATGFVGVALKKYGAQISNSSRSTI